MAIGADWPAGTDGDGIAGRRGGVVGRVWACLGSSRRAANPHFPQRRPVPPTTAVSRDGTQRVVGSKLGVSAAAAIGDAMVVETDGNAWIHVQLDGNLWKEFRQIDRERLRQGGAVVEVST